MYNIDSQLIIWMFGFEEGRIQSILTYHKRTDLKHKVRISLLNWFHVEMKVARKHHEKMNLPYYQAEQLEKQISVKHESNIESVEGSM